MSPLMPSEVQSPEQELLGALQRAFGVSCQLWQRAERLWQPTGGETEIWDEEQRHRAAALCDRAAAQGTPQLGYLAPTWCAVALPLISSRQVLQVATAVACDADPDQLLRQAELFLDAHQLREQNRQLREVNDSLTLQVTESFEELAFVRALASHLQLPGSAQDPLRTAPAILEKLRLTIKAEGLCLALAGTSDDASHPGVEQILWASRSMLNELQCRELMTQLCGQARQRPLILNHVSSSALSSQYPNLRQVVVVEVGKRTVRGWLAAFNREHPRTRPGCRVSEQEFGTVEATLMQSAASSLATHFHNVELLRQKEELFTEVVRALVNAVEARDPYTCGHSERVALYSRRLGEEISLDREDCDQIYLSGLLHDVGKIAVSDATLRKPGRLTDAEFEEISRHPDQGWAILHDLEHLRDILPGVLYHHERYDGKGYPLGLAGDAIPLEGRIMAICDAYDAMTSNRPYRQGMSQSSAEQILRDGAGVQWDPELLEAFFRAMPDIIRIRETYRPRKPSSLPPLPT